MTKRKHIGYTTVYDEEGFSYKKEVHKDIDQYPYVIKYTVLKNSLPHISCFDKWEADLICESLQSEHEDMEIKVVENNYYLR